MKKLTPEIISALIRSVGTHQGRREYSPIEVAEYFDLGLRNDGISRSQLGQMVLLNPSMIGRFTRLLDLPSEVKLLIDWAGTGAPITMSTASEIARLDCPEAQKILAYSVLENRMTKQETQEVIQLVSSGASELPDAILRTIQARPKIDRRLVYVGALAGQATLDSLAQMTQLERDALFSTIMEQLLPPGIEYTSRLGKDRFIVTGDEKLQRVFQNMLNGFEAELSRLIAVEIDV